MTDTNAKPSVAFVSEIEAEKKEQLTGRLKEVYKKTAHAIENSDKKVVKASEANANLRRLLASVTTMIDEDKVTSEKVEALESEVCQATAPFQFS